MNTLAQSVLTMFGVRLTTRQLHAFGQYEQELLEWNTRFNLTAIRDAETMRTKHFLDSLSLLLILRPLQNQRLVDIGSGAGFPGIPLKIALPNYHITLVESVGKKANFCRHMAQVLQCEKIDIMQNRAEELGQMPNCRESFHWAVARAVANLNTLAEYMLPLVRVGGVMIAQKGESGPAEAHAAENAIRLLGGRIRQIIPITLPGVVEERFLIVIDKVATTPPGYPRRVGIPSKTPLH